MSNREKGTGLATGLAGFLMIAMGVHMLGHDEPGWWVPFDIIGIGLGIFDVAIGYALITTGEK